MITKRKLQKEIDQLKQDNAMLRLLTRAYMRRNAMLEEDIALLNASLDCAVLDKEKWQGIAHKADERRRSYVRNVDSAD